MENVNTSLHSKEESKNKHQWWKTHCKFRRSLIETGDVKKEKGFGDQNLFLPLTKARIGGQLLLLWKVVFLNGYWIEDQIWVNSVTRVGEKMRLVFGIALAFSSFIKVFTMDAISGEA